MDYAWGHNSIGVFEDEVKKAKKNLVGTVSSPIGTKDFSTYITKIRQSGADACFLVLAGVTTTPRSCRRRMNTAGRQGAIDHIDRGSEQHPRRR